MHQSRTFHINDTKMLPRLNTGFMQRVQRQNLLGTDRAEPSKEGGGGRERHRRAEERSWVWGIQYCVIPINVYLWHLLFLFSSLGELNKPFFQSLYFGVISRGVCKKVLSDFLVEILRNMIDLLHIERHHIIVSCFQNFNCHWLNNHQNLLTEFTYILRVLGSKI